MTSAASERAGAAGAPGTNAGSDRDDRPESHRLKVHEIFHSIQGESTWAGVPCTFVRLTGCPLRCVWCDTAYAFHGGERMTLDEVVASVAATSASVVEITGGEPLSQPAAYELTDRLLAEGYT
ncbi:MAG: 7-carboxy-7-deazaguanine synthase QueE, partial [Myxococcota bacterium]